MDQLVTFGEVMLRLSPPNFQRISQAQSFDAFYGGGEANVAVGVAQLGIESTHVTCFPDNDLGHAAAAALRKYKVNTDHIRYQGKRLGIYFLETGSSVRASKVIYDRSHSSFSELSSGDFNWDEILKDASWFHWTGITPAISEAAANACLQAVKTAKKLGLQVSGDITFRKNLWQYGKSVQQILPGMVEYCDLIICGESEASEVFGIEPGADDVPYESYSKQLMKKFPNLKKIIGTKRETINASNNRLGGFMWNGDKLYETNHFDISPIVDRIGGGDAFMAGFIFAALSGYDDHKSLLFATACSVLKHTIPGDAGMSSIQEIEQIMDGESIGRLFR